MEKDFALSQSLLDKFELLFSLQGKWRHNYILELPLKLLAKSVEVLISSNDALPWILVDLRVYCVDTMVT